MDENFTPEDLAYINEPFNQKDLEYIKSTHEMKE